MLPNIHISLSVCVVCYKTPPDQLITLVDSLSVAFQKLKERYRLSNVPLYIVDNSSDDESLNDVICAQSDKFKELPLEFHYIKGQGNIGYGSAHNLILDKLNSDFHLILNPDVIVDEEALVNAFAAIDRDNSVIAISPNALNMLGEKQHLCKRYPSIFTLFIRGFFPDRLKGLFAERLSAYEMRELSDTTESKEIELVSGCFMLLKTQVFQLVGGFDKGYFLYFEDFDLSIRMRKYGKLAFAPQVRIRHLGGKAAKKGLRHIYTFVKSGYRFFNAHGWHFF